MGEGGGGGGEGEKEVKRAGFGGGEAMRGAGEGGRRTSLEFSDATPASSSSARALAHKLFSVR